MKVIVLTGMPAAGKSTLAAHLSETFDLVILEKDALKEELFDTVGFRSYAEKRKLDHAANAVLLRCAESMLSKGISLILDNNFDTESAARLSDILTRYNCDCITIFLGGDSDVFYQRYVKRDNQHKRHLGHILQDRFPPAAGDCLDYEMTRDEFGEKFEKRGMSSFQCPGYRINVDAAAPEGINIEELIEQIRKFMES